MYNPANSGHFLRRKDKRRRVQFSAIAHCHGISRAIEVVDFSNTGLRIDKVSGLAAGDTYVARAITAAATSAASSATRATGAITAPVRATGAGAVRVQRSPGFGG